MRTISKTSRFRSDFKKLLRNPRYRGFESILDEVVTLLIAEVPLPANFHDHTLAGNWIGCRECHLKPDLLLVYREENAVDVTLLRLGTHSELFR